MLRTKKDLFVLLVLVLSACSGSPSLAPTASQIPSFAGTLRIYQTATSTSTPTPPLYKSLTPTSTATPTPTPVTYTVQQKDDMYGIAFLFGISPQALMTANPTVDPRAMSVGTVLIIPVTPSAPGKSATPTITVTPTPAIVTVERFPDCYPDVNDGEWCFLLVKNDQTGGLENVTGAIRLTANDQAEPLQATATTLLDVLPAGASAPLVAYFPAPLPAGFTAAGEVISALPQPAADQRYLAVSLQNQQVGISPDGLSAAVQGTLSLPAGSATANQIWVAAAAFSIDGAVVGVRKWESTGPLAGGKSLPFDFQVYSLGPPIDHVSLLVQARP